jgi:hypothetical protein
MTTALSGKPTFGAGRVFGAAAVTNPTPVRFPVPQSQSIDFKRKVESLFGENQLAVAVGAGQMDVTGQIEFGKSHARVYADLLIGSAGTTGSYLEADKETAAVPGTGPYTIQTVNHTTWLFDLGVVDVATGNIMSCVAAGSEVAAKAYSVAAGVYTFAAGDEGVSKQISYGYSNATAGETVTLTNQLQGQTGAFKATHVLPWGAEQDMFVLNNCISSSGGMSAKSSGFGTSTLEYTAAVDTTGILGVATFAEAA